jgi:hypothetical protein
MNGRNQWVEALEKKFFLGNGSWYMEGGKKFLEQAGIQHFLGVPQIA